MFDTKIAIIVRDDLANWQKLNVTAFLMSGIAGANPDIIGEPYQDAAANSHLPMSVQPVIVLTGAGNVMTNIRNRAHSRGVETVAYIEEMFATGRGAAAIVEEGGLAQVTDSGAIEALVDSVLAEHQDKVAQYKGGKDKLLGFFVGQVMQKSQGRASPQLVNELLKSKLAG